MLETLVLGLHIASHHLEQVPNGRDVNPGVYAVVDGGWTAGAYRNTWGRTSVYLGRTVPLAGPFELTVGGVTGYRRRLVDCAAFEADGRIYTKQWQGSSRYSVAPLLALSAAVPLGGGAAARVTLGANVVHLSVEWRK